MASHLLCAPLAGAVPLAPQGAFGPTGLCLVLGEPGAILGVFLLPVCPNFSTMAPRAHALAVSPSSLGLHVPLSPLVFSQFPLPPLSFPWLCLPLCKPLPHRTQARG